MHFSRHSPTDCMVMSMSTGLVSINFLNFLHLSSHNSGPQLQSMIPPDDEVAKSERIVLSAALLGRIIKETVVIRR